MNCSHCATELQKQIFRVGSDIHPQQNLFRRKDPVILCPCCDAPEDPPSLRFPHPA